MENLERLREFLSNQKEITPRGSREEKYDFLINSLERFRELSKNIEILNHSFDKKRLNKLEEEKRLQDGGHSWWGISEKVYRGIKVYNQKIGKDYKEEPINRDALNLYFDIIRKGKPRAPIRDFGNRSFNLLEDYLREIELVN